MKTEIDKKSYDRLLITYLFIFTIINLKFYEYNKMRIEYESQKDILKKNS